MAHRVRLRRRSAGSEEILHVSVEDGATLLAAVRAAGLPIARACAGEGLCGRCGVELLEGAERVSPEAPDETDGKRRARLEPGLRLACQARVHGPLLVTASYW